MMDIDNIDFSKITKRLKMIQSLISLEEEEEISVNISKLEKLALPVELENIIIYLKEKSYSKAVRAIERFINQHNSLTIYLDPEIDALKLEIKSLEGAINLLSDEKADLEKLINEFGIKHNKELGELIIKILQYRKDNTKGTPQQQEAEDDYNTYHNEHEATKNESIATLSDEEYKDLKDKYRKASKLCHPDVVSDEQKELATKLFAELSAAYKKNDIKRVREILENLENGHFFISKSDTINEKMLLQAEIEKQRLKVKELEDQLLIIKESDTYKVISGITNWDGYFLNAKEKLRLQLNELEGAK